MGQGPFLAIPGETNTFQFSLYEADGSDLNTSPTLASGDFKIIIDGSALANTDNLPAHEGGGCCSWVMSAAESTEGSVVTMLARDQTGTQDWLSTSVDVVVQSLPEVGVRYYTGAAGVGIFIDATNGTAGSTLGVHGTPAQPTTTWANALTLAGKLGVNRFYIKGGTSLTMTGAIDDYAFYGLGEFADSTITLGSQTYGDAKFENLRITGTGSSSTGRGEFIQCFLDDITNFHGIALGCGLNGTIDLTNNDDHVFDQCFSMVAGGGTPVIDLASNVDVSMRHYSGGIQIDNGGNTNSFSLEGMGQVVLDASTSNFTLNLRGMWKETDNGSGNTIDNEAAYNRSTGSSNVNVVSMGGYAPYVDATVTDATYTATQTQFELTTDPFGSDNAPIGLPVIFPDSGDSAYGSNSFVVNYDSTEKLVTVRAMTNAPVSGDTVRFILA